MPAGAWGGTFPGPWTSHVALIRCNAQWRAVAEAPQLWRAACLAVPQWREDNDACADGGVALLERHCDRFFDASWRAMYLLRPRLRTDGLYVSRCASAAYACAQARAPC